MKAMIASEFGDPSVLQLREIEPPVAGEGEVVIEVRATAVNPVDTKIRSGAMSQRGGNEKMFQPPLVLGFDVSGVIAEVGQGVDGRWSVGDEVYASPPLAGRGANAERVAVDARLIAAKPAALTHEEAAAMPLVTLTAWEALHDHARLAEGETVLIHAGGGGVGHIAIQLARHAGCRVLTTASRDDSRGLCEAVGADLIIDYKDEDILQRIQKETDGRGCDVVFDTVGGDTFKASLDLVSVFGRVVTILPPPEDASIGKLFGKSAELHTEFMGAAAMHGVRLERQGEILREAASAVAAGWLRPHVSQVYGFDELPDAHRQQETGHTTGKLVVQVS